MAHLPPIPATVPVIIPAAAVVFAAAPGILPANPTPAFMAVLLLIPLFFPYQLIAPAIGVMWLPFQFVLYPCFIPLPVASIDQYFLVIF